MYIDTGSSVPGVPSKSRDLVDENKKKFDGMEMIRNNRINLSSVHCPFILLSIKNIYTNFKTNNGPRRISWAVLYGSKNSI